MKKYIAFLFSAFLSYQASACDKAVAKFPRDCKIQDRYLKLKSQLAKSAIDINELAEYRALRMIDRGSWEKAKVTLTPVNQIYKPAPLTWEIWDNGIRNIFGKTSFKGVLFGEYPLNETMMKVMNMVLLTRGEQNVKDSHTDRKVQPGNLRKKTDKTVGFCSDGKEDHRSLIAASNASSLRFQSKWESAMGTSLAQLVSVRYAGVQPTETAQFGSEMSVGNFGCDRTNRTSVFVNYLPSGAVAERLQWFVTFVEENLNTYRNNKPVLSPIEFATYTQKWLVSIHPFSDGNGRTSRAVQDTILANFDMPFAPAGDLQNDVEVEFETYLENTYSKIEDMLQRLESCADLKMRNAETPYQCKTVAELL
jgi:prophage maintenance system killer protein